MSVHFGDSRTFCVGNYQQYLAKNPLGYRCYANTGVKFPETA